jgi:arsenate reductase
MPLMVEILLTDKCPHGTRAVERTRRVLESLAPEATLTTRTVRDREEALALSFPGSPTIRVNNVDLEGSDAGPPALACRRYGSEGAPPSWLIEAGVLRGLAPKHLLFLCVANSARSQIAEALARSMAPGEMRVSSAGSEPTRLRPEAVQVLEEIGVATGGQHAKGVEAIEGEVEAVITLCAEEVCPVWLTPARRVHWGLPDPAVVVGGGERRLEAFREVRDELRRRLGVLFSSPGSPF